MTSNGYYPKKLIYLGDGFSERKAVLVSSPDEYADAILETIDLGDSAFEDKYRQVAAAAGAEFVDINDIVVVGQSNQPTSTKITEVRMMGKSEQSTNLKLPGDPRSLSCNDGHDLCYCAGHPECHNCGQPLWDGYVKEPLDHSDYNYNHAACCDLVLSHFTYDD